jgi:hypothetical protein
MEPANERLMTDALLVRTFAMPNGNTTTTSTSIDFGADPYPTTGSFECKLELAGGVSAGEPSKTAATITIQGSSDDSSWSPLDPAISFTYASGSGGNNTLPINARFALGPNTPRYIRVHVQGVSGIDNSSVTGKLTFLF